MLFITSTEGLLWADAGVGNVLGNKGGVGVALTYMKHTRLLFVNAHFAAHDHKVAQRQADYLRIKAGLFNSREEPGVSLLLRPCCHCCCCCFCCCCPAVVPVAAAAVVAAAAAAAVCWL